MVEMGEEKDLESAQKDEKGPKPEVQRRLFVRSSRNDRRKRRLKRTSI